MRRVRYGHTGAPLSRDEVSVPEPGPRAGFRPGDRATGLCFGHGHAGFTVLREAATSPLPGGASPAPDGVSPVDTVDGSSLTSAPPFLAPGGRLVAYASGGGTIRAYDPLVGATTVAPCRMPRIADEQPELYER
ncbi:hypothetical protein GCM10023084_38230 [Streptomyces lacrimifluminis]|uniref:Uncharacterized protein n=1 Tax=Streptomyces lacrimifluminis TaxID=1500077 RepID=A0A917L0K3_9ACTN|nr:hypothetical protein GCM10012282_39850 [Streptomyces lacrimifluminis]